MKGNKKIKKKKCKNQRFKNKILMKNKIFKDEK